MIAIYLLLSFIVPPLPVYLHRGVGRDLVLNILLTFLGGIPGILHSLWIVATSTEELSEESTGNTP